MKVVMEDRKLKVVMVDVEKVLPYGYNPRVHHKYQVEQIEDSIKEFGFTNPILIDDANVVIAGHGRLEAAKNLGMKQVPTIMIVGLSKAQRRAYVIADNNLTLKSDWDTSMLRKEIEELTKDNYNLDLLGFDPDEIGDLFMTDDPEGLDDITPPNKDFSLQVLFPDKFSRDKKYNELVAEGLVVKAK